MVRIKQLSWGGYLLFLMHWLLLSPTFSLDITSVMNGPIVSIVNLVLKEIPFSRNLSLVHLLVVHLSEA
ncbi:unnamed protein product [Coffea canephora]|uniref:Uncharacterized protein n=1 Tax=Coffea canephora TaxID=49390 RepID=A0A068USN6_COFCA|nr:unnamed protein product [Coffea canephora]